MGKDKPFPTQPSLVGKKVYLRAETADDVVNHHMWFLQSEPQSMTVHPLPFMNLAEVTERFKKAEKSPYAQAFAVISIKENKPVGKVSFFNYNDVNRSAELGILIDPDERKNDYATEALQILIEYLFMYRNLNKVYAETAEFNTGTIKLLESLGFHRDGVLRQHHYFNGEYHNKFAYSLIRYEVDW
ncbi:MAG: N-acetyltransferase [Calditrichaeota bacterium]|nr:MAG: N-acetyltransferase [Calditrichota bacterium]